MTSGIVNKSLLLTDEENSGNEIYVFSNTDIQVFSLLWLWSSVKDSLEYIEDGAYR